MLSVKSRFSRTIRIGIVIIIIKQDVANNKKNKESSGAKCYILYFILYICFFILARH